MIFFVVFVVLLLGGSEVDLFIPSFPDMMNYFNITPFMIQLTLGVNFFSYCIGSFCVGYLGDRFGARTVILYSMIIFVVGSFVCFVTNGFWILILGRFLQGLGMAGPAALGYVVIAKNTPLEKHVGQFGALNGAISMAMAFAPVIGSYISFSYGWKGNFLALLIFGIICLVLCFIAIPKDNGNNSSSIMLFKSYLPLLTSKTFLKYVGVVCFLSASYWTFIGMGPIFYINSMGVSIKSFGFYQGSLAGLYAVTSIFSGKILNIFGVKTIYRFAGFLMMITVTIMFIISMFMDDNPLVITTIVSLLMMECALPQNIAYAAALNLIPDTQGKAAAIINICRLGFSAISLSIVSYFYNGTFTPLAIMMLLFFIIVFLCMKKSNQWIKPE